MFSSSKQPSIEGGGGKHSKEVEFASLSSNVNSFAGGASSAANLAMNPSSKILSNHSTSSSGSSGVANNGGSQLRGTNNNGSANGGGLPGFTPKDPSLPFGKDSSLTLDPSSAANNPNQVVMDHYSWNSLFDHNDLSSSLKRNNYHHENSFINASFASQNMNHRSSLPYIVDTSASSSSSHSFGYTPQPFHSIQQQPQQQHSNVIQSNPHHQRSSFSSLESHFASTSFFGSQLSIQQQQQQNNIPFLERPATPPDSSVSFEAAVESSNNNSADRPEAMRTLYFGNLPPDLPISDFLNYVRGGVVEEIKYLQQKNCVFVTFLEASVAAAVYIDYQCNPFCIDGYEVRVGWGKPSTLHPSIRNHVLKGASRNVFIGNLEPDQVSIDALRLEFSHFGVVDLIKILPEKRIGFVHLCSISSAIKAVHALSEHPDWSQRRIYYGRDRCSTQGPPPPSLTPTLPEENRTVYIGGIHAEVTTKDLCDVIRGGLLQQIKYFPEKNICFATFISADSAAEFYERSVADGLVLRAKRMKIGWGKPSQLPLSIESAVARGASRNVYIGSIDDTITKELLYSEFEEFGEIELVNIVPEKKIGFISFTDITSAIKAVETMRMVAALANGEAPASTSASVAAAAANRVCLFKRVNFGKDRCANAFRPAKPSVSPPSSPPFED